MQDTDPVEGDYFTLHVKSISALSANSEAAHDPFNALVEFVYGKLMEECHGGPCADMLVSRKDGKTYINVLEDYDEDLCQNIIERLSAAGYHAVYVDDLD